MTGDTFRKLEQVFSDALALDSDQHAALIENLATRSPKLAQQLNALLTADGDVD